MAEKNVSSRIQFCHAKLLGGWCQGSAKLVSYIRIKTGDCQLKPHQLI